MSIGAISGVGGPDYLDQVAADRHSDPAPVSPLNSAPPVTGDKPPIKAGLTFPLSASVLSALIQEVMSRGGV